MLVTPPYLTSELHVAILLCTYNGEKFLGEQLASYLAQTHTNWSLWVGDDHSSDGTWQILEQFQRDHPERTIVLRHGPARGFVCNFLTLACDAKIEADYFAFSDQDDVWYADKLARALACLVSHPSKQPLLYGARSEFIDVQGKVIGSSKIYDKPKTFSNALVQCIMGGNTMVFNRATRGLLMEAGSQCDAASHDWFTYQLVTGTNGHVHYDTTPAIGYRQYRGAMSGSNRGLWPSIIRIYKLMGGTFREWNGKNLVQLDRLSGLLSEAHRQQLREFQAARRNPLFRRVMHLVRSGVYRQTMLGNLALIWAALTNRL